MQTKLPNLDGLKKLTPELRQKAISIALIDILSELLERRHHHVGHKKGLALSLNQIDYAHDTELGELVKDYQSRGGPRVHWWNEEEGSAYAPHFDVVTITETDKLPEELRSAEYHRRTTIHELVHSTGHNKRLSRKGLANANPNPRTYALEEIIAERGAQIVMKEKGWLTPELKEKGNEYIARFAHDFEVNEGTTLGEVRLEAEPFAVAAAELVLGKKLSKRKAKAKVKARKRKELVTA